MTNDIRESARQHLADAEKRGGKVYAAIIRGEGCCQVNDPDYSREWWLAVLVEYDALLKNAEQAQP